jgi:glycerol-3-phosphate dehydrogenase
MLELISGGEASHKLIRSKGIHLITHRLTNGRALAVGHKGGHIFVLPWREHTILGTTDTVFTGRPDDLKVTADDVDSYLAFVNEALPALKLQPDHVLYAYAGLRPLVDDGSKDSYNASRRAELVDHAAEGGPQNLISAIGGKWTTSRDNAEKCVDMIARKLGLAKACDTAEAPLPGAPGRFKPFAERFAAEAHELAPSSARNLARNYGARGGEVLTLARKDAGLLRTVSQRLPDIAAQVTFAVRSEMAMTLDDVLFRRTGLGTLGPLDPSAIGDVAALMARERGWSEDERARQVASIAWRYEALT